MKRCGRGAPVRYIIFAWPGDSERYVQSQAADRRHQKFNVAHLQLLPNLGPEYSIIWWMGRALKQQLT
jgi:hypothetical protein